MSTLLGDWPVTKDTDAAQAVADVLPATMKHQPTKLDEYRTYRRHVAVTDSYGDVGTHRELEREADAWLMAKVAYKLTDTGIVEVPRSELRIPDPESYNFHDRATRHDRQDPYTVNIGTSSDIGEALCMPSAGNATRIAKLAPKNDAPRNYTREVHGCSRVPYTGVSRLDGSITHADHKRDQVTEAGEFSLIALATGYRGKQSIGHGPWITPTGKDGRPTTRVARIEAAEAQLSDVQTVERAEAGRTVTRRLLNGAQNVRIQTIEGMVITVRKVSQSSIKVDVKRAQKRVKGSPAPKASTTCSHESYIHAAIERMLTKLS